MSATRIHIWDFKNIESDNPPKNIKEIINIELQKTKELQTHFRGELLNSVTKKIDECIQINFSENVKNIKQSAAVFPLYNEFFIYEMIKNSYDAHAINMYAFINEQETTVTTTHIDDGDGLINLEKHKNYFMTALYYHSEFSPLSPPPLTPYFLADRHRCLNYLRVVDPDFDISQPESEENILCIQNKITSEKKISLTSEKKHAGGKGEFLKRIALFAHSVGGVFLMMDVNDFKKSEEHLNIAGIQDKHLLPETGAVFILQLPKFSKEFDLKFQPHLKNRILDTNTIENHYYLTLHPKAKGNLGHKAKPPRLKIKMIPRTADDDLILFPSTLTTTSQPTYSFSSPTSTIPSPTSTSTSRSISSFSSPTSKSTSRSNSSTASPTSKASLRSTSSLSLFSRSTSSLSSPTPRALFSPFSEDQDNSSEIQNISITVETATVSQQGFFAPEESSPHLNALSIDVSSPLAPLSPDTSSPVSVNNSTEQDQTVNNICLRHS